MSRSYVHLHCHTHYSLLDGANRIPELVEQTKALGMNACAITDHGNMYGAVEFYGECKKCGIKPIIGYEAYLAPGSRHDKKALRQGDAYSHLTLLAKNEAGFKNLIKMSSIAFTEGFYYHPRIDRELLEAHSEGVVCLSGCLAGEFNDWILKGDNKKAKATAEWFAKVFKEDFYVEIQNNGLDLQDQCTPEAVKIANKLGVPLVATADAHYLCQTDAEAHDVLFCINTGRKREPGKKNYPEGKMKSPYYVRSPEDMYKLFPGMEEAVNQSQKIADGIDLQIDFKKRHFPVFQTPGGKSANDYLRELCEQGLLERYGGEPRAEVRARLEHELGIICKMGFAGYFLIVWDFVRFARENGIPCSARGSACGAVVGFALYMSHVDPLEYDLLFERFLDPNRSEAPDIDIDFCQDRREMVIDYVKRKYGVESVAQIATFGTMAAKAAIKDVGRVLDIPLERVNYMTKWVSPKPGATIEETLKMSAEFRKEYESSPLTKEWIDIALKLEGTNRNVGTHAAGVVIANGPITDYVPIQVVKRKDESGEAKAALTTQWVMGDLEKVGMLKMDFLGLRTLTLVDNCVKFIEQTRGIKVDVQQFPLDDVETYKMLQKGDAKGVFQFESEGIRELLKRMKPDNIRDIIASTALYRPGPLEGGMVEEYIECKHGRKQPVYPHPIMEEVLSETYGVMVYQEQVMRMLNKLGGIELSSAYACIKAISKKKQEIIDARKIDFINGAKSRGLAEEKANDIFEMIVKFGGYGFNKSHSAAYALVSYQTAYLKRHYTAEFFAALLTSEIEDSNKRDIMVDHISDARKFGLQVLAPDVNRGAPNFTVDRGQIIFGLVAIKGLGRKAADEIFRVRQEGGAFKDIYDFCERIDSREVSRKAVEQLIKAGGMDDFAQPFAHRAQLLAALTAALSQAEEQQKDRRRGQMNIFDVMGGDGAGAGEGGGAQGGLPQITRWSNTEQLKHEKDALDFYFSSHPLAEWDAMIKRYASHTCAMVNAAKNGSEVRFGGMISQMRLMTTKRGGRYVRCKIEDLSSQLECVMWPDEFTRFANEFADDKISLFEAAVEDDMKGSGKVIVLKRLMSIEQARNELTKSMHVTLNMISHGPETVDSLKSILKRTRGECSVFASIVDAAGKRANFRLSSDYNIDPSKVAFEEIELLLGSGSVSFSGR